MKTKFVDSNEKKKRFYSNKLYEKEHWCTNRFFSEIIVLLKLYLVSPATNAVSEQSASSMRRLKNWLRSTMSQERLNQRYFFQYIKKNLMK